MRVDLPATAGEEELLAADVAARMEQARAASVLLVVYASRGRGRPLPMRRLVHTVERRLAVPLRDALLVDGNRVWSYLCDLPQCCPPEGRAIDGSSPGATALAAAHALQGDVVLADRDALVATTRAVGGVAAVSMRQAQERAVDRMLDELAVSDRPTESIRLVADVCARFADPPVELPHDDAADVALRVHDVRVRDRVLRWVARRDQAAELMVRAVARLAQPPDDAPIAGMLAWCGYLRGDGVVAVAAAERALATDPSYSLAHLVLDCVSRQLEPRAAREVWADQDVDDDDDDLP
jgi:hypothetical protein